jgi:hypothetical protein
VRRRRGKERRTETACDELAGGGGAGAAALVLVLVLVPALVLGLVRVLVVGCGWIVIGVGSGTTGDHEQKIFEEPCAPVSILQ